MFHTFHHTVIIGKRTCCYVTTLCSYWTTSTRKGPVLGARSSWREKNTLPGTNTVRNTHIYCRTLVFTISFAVPVAHSRITSINVTTVAIWWYYRVFQSYCKYRKQVWRICTMNIINNYVDQIIIKNADSSERWSSMYIFFGLTVKSVN